MALLGMMLAALLGYSFFSLMMLCRRGVETVLEAPISTAEKGGRFSIRVSVRRAGGTALGKMKMRVGWRNVMRRNWEHVTLAAQEISAGSSEWLYGLVISEAGCYEFRLESLLIYDRFCAFHRKKKCGSGTYVYVLPEIHEISVSIGERVRNFYGDSDIYDELRPGYDPGEVFDVREFRDGDRLSSVLWKLSAKGGELMVRENSLPRACPVRLFLYACRDGGEGMLESIAGLAYSLMDAKCAFYAVWMSRSRKEVLRVRVDDEESYYLFLVSYMQDCSPDFEGDLETLYREKYRGEYGLHAVAFRDGKVFQNGQELTGGLGEGILLS